jgi:peptidoglycan/xylan/chitin deacetylase (PgdA/CDA1 family)
MNKKILFCKILLFSLTSIYTSKNEINNEYKAKQKNKNILEKLEKEIEKIILNLKSEYKDIIEIFLDQNPTIWSENAPYVKTKLKITNPEKKIIALTFDLCGGRTDGADYRYIDYLIQNKIPVTIFITSKWMLRHPKDFQELLKYPEIFNIQNHGLLHKPCSCNGNSAYGIQGTSNILEIIEEVVGNAKLIKLFSKKEPLYYRSGTAYYDDIATKLINLIGYKIVGYSILGDAGASFSADETYNSLLKAQNGDIIILHMNRPETPCALGAIKAIEELKNNGFTFVKIEDYEIE